ncbi:NAD(P) transhydrogenase subunit alpha [Aureimonas altamirensis]|uniref:NAD(P) transhydrogenase subunit alpha n=1 Tax=Aureimonas altamirensis TaxID=370622 RepID=UPI001E2AFCB9|nr:NAD(P) transhydrogenase subunit alpha [Aureimonas altamirensis]UHD44081.1 NAD(P) transhydrogenase subunit alpha [Aureimonas altamirensis]
MRGSAPDITERRSAVMTITISILKETSEGEKRVAMVPSVASRLERLGTTLSLQSGAGEPATFADNGYAAGTTIVAETDQLVADADIVLAVQPPPIAVVQVMKPGAVLISFLYGANNPELVAALLQRKVTALAMELIPRISRAQSMDALSSQAALAGYYAPLLGAVHMPRILPMMTTAVGSLRAAKVLVIGLGVAGLSALATAHRLGAITEGYDVRPETKEQAQSLGAKFVDTGVDARGEGGYARELTAEEKERVEKALSQHIAEADMIVTTAAVPGRPAPKLISAAQIAAMKPGSVIVDLGAEGGGNCEGTKPGETVTIGPATIIGPLNVPSALAQHASELYAKNLLNLIGLIVKDGALNLDFEDEVIAGATLTHAGEIRIKAVRERLEAQKDPAAANA